MSLLKENTIMNKSKHISRIASCILWILLWGLLILLDLGTKAVAAQALQGKPPIVLIHNVLELLYLQNTGAAFSLFENAQWLFILIAVLAVIFITLFLVRIPKNRRFLPLQILLTLISAGAIGNLIDRIRLGYVRDFIYFSLIDFPVFNVADIYVTVSTALLVLVVLFYYKEEDFHFLHRKS